MTDTRPRWRRTVAAIVVACSVAYVLLFVPIYAPRVHRVPLSSPFPATSPFNNLHLTETECRSTFPGLMDPIDEQVRRGPFQLQPASDLGPLQARVRGGQLRIVSTEKHGLLPPELLDARVATLHQINRALLTAPFLSSLRSREESMSSLPSSSPASLSSPDGSDSLDDSLDTVFSINIQDQPYGSAFTYSLPAYAAPTAGNAPIGRAFLMPHFSFWAWRPPMVGSFARASAEIDRIEAEIPFSRKKPQAVWRGTTRFSSAHHPELRKALLTATHNQSWADVQALDWLPDGSNANAMQEASNSLMIEDFCQYKYVIHTEGITYSGRFQFHQLCGSVVLTAPLAWMQHTAHLVRPLYASDLPLEGTPWKPTADEEKAWPHSTPNEANIVFVSPDWSNLGATIQWLEKHPRVAEDIARRQRQLFASGPYDRGYHSPAAEVCYWRGLLAGWKKVVQYNDTDVGEGEPWESFSLDPRQ
ncbi:hypothetical protein Sste5346_004096 [Sporothrix stenoceras]|uniref:Glycosyl transferase CAP10 domain-containing protein n=1 Tax=Sporothrix stenoceras TaxID=5173 RepID=A0ABR3ZBF4_9PEZI